MAKAKAKANNIPSSRLPQFRPAGQAMLGVKNVVSRQMSHFPQPRQHLPHSGQALHASQAAPMAYQPARPESSAPLLSQQQSGFPGGYFPTTGPPMPPPSYTYQPSSVPPLVVQPPDTALDQSLPLVKSQMQPWHQPLSSLALLPSVNSAEPSSSDWQVHTCTNGKRYYHNKKTRQSSWGKPVELMTPLDVTQCANAKVKSAEPRSSDWQENTSTDGRKYYYNKKTRQSSWVKPAELMIPLEDLEKEDEKQKQLQQKQARRQERKRRDDFRRMLEEHVADGILTAKTRWLPYCDQVKSSHAYLGVASNTTGSTPKDLFEDVMEDLEEQYEADKSQIKEAIESGKLPMMASCTFEDFQTAFMKIGTFKGISDINMKLIYAKLIVRLREKELNEAKKRDRLGDHFSDLLYSIMEISASSAWDDSKPLFEDSQEYRDLNNETYARDLFEKRLFNLKERLKEKERLREEEKAKKEKEREEKERKREYEEKERKKETMKEKERKEKERKEREREKERERDKGKDWSRRDGVHFDGAAANIHGSKDKKSDKDKENKQKRCHHDTGDDVISERDDSSHSQRHNSDRKKSRKDIMLQTPIVKTGAKDLQGLRVFPQKLCT